MKKRTFAFHSTSDPHNFIARIQEEAKREGLKIEPFENGFSLHIDSHHGGRVFYQANVSANENGGSLIEGKIVTIPWNEVKSKTKLQKVMGAIGYVLGGIVLSPIIVLIFLVLAFDELFSICKNKGKRDLPREEENLLNFMVNKMCCEQK